MAKRILGKGVSVDAQVLVESRLLIQANSGGGKSYAIRKLLEITYGACQHIVLDVEGEFHTLREKYDYALAGKGGEGPADIKSAAMLARRLLELNVSCIIDIYELGTQRAEFIKRFLESLVDAPRSLWHPAIVIVDEAQKFCPENAKAVSGDAVANLMTLGRKRGFCGVLATQRISDLSKSAAAECNNKLIGRCGLDVDQNRAGKELGFQKREDVIGLRNLLPGEFYAFGPAFKAPSVIRFNIGTVQTTHPRAGQRAMAPTPPREKVKKVLGQLADIPHEAEEEARTAGELREKVRQLERELRSRKAATTPAPPAAKVERRDVPIIKPAELKRLEAAIARTEKLAHSVASSGGDIGTAMEMLRQELSDAQRAMQQPQPSRTVVHQPAPPRTARPDDRRRASPSPQLMQGTQTLAEKIAKLPGGDKLNAPQQRIVNVIATLNQLDIDAERGTVAAWCGSHPRSAGFVANVGSLRSAGLLEDYRLTDAGRAAAQASVPRDEDDLREIVMSPLNGPKRRILELVLEHGEIDREQLAELYGVHMRSAGFVANIGALRSRGLLTAGWPIKATDALFMPAS